ncbi:MAG: dTDP-4-dehydrorhamnose 3,5-epimerase [Flavobacteriales bacterium]
MNFTETILKGCYTVDLNVFEDSRGWFARTYCEDEFKKIEHDKPWVQINHSFTAKKGAIRGMHFQLPPYAEIKLVRCIAGSVFDVVIDLRKNSPTFLKWIGVELSGVNKKMIYIPQGFAHGFQALSDNVELIYQHSAAYNSESESGIRYDDKTIKIDWKLPVTDISEKDKCYALLNEHFKGLEI